jgi:integrase
VSEAEYKALGKALRKTTDETFWPPAVAAVRFLCLTGWRSGEALGLKWSDLDLVRRTATLADTKTGRSIRPLSRSACDLLLATRRLGPLVFPASRGDGQMTGFASFWARISKLASLPADVTPHVLRHSFASVADDLECSELTIAALLGHRKASVTAKYTHKADTVLLAAADAVADRIADLMGDAKPSGVVIELARRA